MTIKDLKLAIIGLGYVGLPLTVEFAKKRHVIAFDISKSRIQELKKGVDKTLEVANKEIIKNDNNITFTDNIKILNNCNCYIIAVPTPIQLNKNPNLNPIKIATNLVAKILKKNDIIIYESTVYPGVTEEVCVPIIEKISGLKFNIDFYCGYSPERINPGDKTKSIRNIKKITSGSNKATANLVDKLYKEIILAGTHKTSSIKVAEAAKVIENTQRDINIAFINELSRICKGLGIDTKEVIDAAKTKWNFIPFYPGLVGGHCIGIDPYYLTFKAKSIGYNPKIILSGRSINDNMSNYVVKELLLAMRNKKIKIKKAKILIMGFSFKENCPDIRNTKVYDVYKKLKKNNCIVDIYDPWVDPYESANQYDINLIKKLNKPNNYDAIILTVKHKCFRDMGIKKIRNLGKKIHILFDLKYIFPRSSVDIRL